MRSARLNSYRHGHVSNRRSQGYDEATFVWQIWQWVVLVHEQRQHETKEILRSLHRLEERILMICCGVKDFVILNDIRSCICSIRAKPIRNWLASRFLARITTVYQGGRYRLLYRPSARLRGSSSFQLRYLADQSTELYHLGWHYNNCNYDLDHLVQQPWILRTGSVTTIIIWCVSGNLFKSPSKYSAIESIITCHLYQHQQGFSTCFQDPTKFSTIVCPKRRVLIFKFLLTL